MSTQNFVSYGDAETLMSGVKSAIDDATEGSATIRKHIVAEITDRTLTMTSALGQIFTALNSYLSNFTGVDVKMDVMRNTYIYIRNYGTDFSPICHGIYRYMFGAYDRPVYGLVDKGITNDSNYVCSITLVNTTNGNIFALNGVNRASDTLTTLNISRIQIIHQELVEGSNALVNQVAEIESDVSGLDTRVTALEQGGGGSNKLEYIPDGIKTWSDFLREIFSDLTSKKTLEEIMSCDCVYVPTTDGFSSYHLQPTRGYRSTIWFQCINCSDLATANPKTSPYCEMALRLESSYPAAYFGTTSSTTSIPSDGIKIIFNF